MRAIFQREINSYFNTMIGYVFMAIFLLISGFYFTRISLINGSANFTSILSSINLVMVLITPLLTMRLLAEERKNKSDQLLLTSPVSVASIVMGKFFAALAVLIATLAVTAIYPIIMALFGNPYFGEILLGYFGFILLGSCLISVGLFISSITENQLTAAVATLGLLLMLWLMDMIIPQVQNIFLRTILSGLSLYSHFEAFEFGVLSISSIVYFITFSFTFLFLSTRIIEKRRWAKG